MLGVRPGVSIPTLSEASLSPVLASQLTRVRGELRTEKDTSDEGRLPSRNTCWRCDDDDDSSGGGGGHKFSSALAAAKTTVDSLLCSSLVVVFMLFANAVAAQLSFVVRGFRLGDGDCTTAEK